MEPLLTLEEVAAILRIAPFTARKWCRDGTLPGAIKLAGGEWRLRQADLERFIDSRASEGGSERPV